MKNTAFSALGIVCLFVKSCIQYGADLDKETKITKSVPADLKWIYYRLQISFEKDYVGMTKTNIYAKDTSKDRLLGLDIYRILAALFIFLFHSNMHIGCSYGFLSGFVSMGAIYMTAFFLLSGFSLFLVWNKKDLNNIDTIKGFYLKRGIGILPLYYTVALLFIFLYL